MTQSPARRRHPRRWSRPPPRFLRLPHHLREWFTPLLKAFLGGVLLSQPKQIFDAAVVGTEIVSPIGNAMGFVHDEHPDAALNEREKFLEEFAVAQALGRDHEDVHFVGLERSFDLGPFGNVFAVDGDSADAKFFGGEDLIAHEREERAEKFADGRCSGRARFLRGQHYD